MSPILYLRLRRAHLLPCLGAERGNLRVLPAPVFCDREMPASWRPIPRTIYYQPPITERVHG